MAAVGDAGVGKWDPGRAMPVGRGEADRAAGEGDVARASLEGGAIAGLAGLGIPPIREVAPGAGEPERGMPVVKRVTC